jgi:hypothetical protein
VEHSIQLPKARKDKLIIKELADETLVYDLENDQAHCLNSTAARVWQHCDGQRSVTEIAQSLAEQTNTKADETIVWFALDQFGKSNLLESAPTTPPQFGGMNRRQLVRNVGLVALALPVIMSISSPTAAQTASQCACTAPNCLPIGCPCTNPSQCVNHPGSQCSPATGLCV